MNQNISFVKTNKSITLQYGEQTYTALEGSIEFAQILHCLRTNDWANIPHAASKALSIATYTGGIFEIREGCLYMGDKILPIQLTKKILEFKAADISINALCKFADNLLQNPSSNSVNQLFGFLEANNHPITDDGYFIAYKSVRSDWKDTYTGKIDNSPGTVVSIDREAVDPDPTRTCSHGLHVANWEYPNTVYKGDRLIEVKVHPKDVVAVPNDYNNAKMRVSSYKVLGEIERPREEKLLVKSEEPASEDEYDDEESIEEGDESSDY